jgi:hypothetical protein
VSTEDTILKAHHSAGLSPGRAQISTRIDLRTNVVVQVPPAHESHIDGQDAMTGASEERSSPWQMRGKTGHVDDGNSAPPQVTAMSAAA